MARYTPGMVLGSFSKTVAECDIYNFAGLSGDFNPMHLNAEVAAQSRFGKRIAHGMLSGALLSGALYQTGIGNGGIYVSQTLNFRAPVFIGDTVTWTMTVAEYNEEKNRMKVETVATNQDGKVVANGIADIIPGDK